jgi:hypothetical protein
MHKKIVNYLASASDVQIENTKTIKTTGYSEFGSAATIVVSRGRFLTKVFAPR